MCNYTTIRTMWCKPFGYTDTLSCSTTISSVYMSFYFSLVWLHNNISLDTYTPSYRLLSFHCFQCFKVKRKLNTYLKGQLPILRVTQTRPFNTSGVVYAGLFMIKTYLLRTYESLWNLILWIQPIQMYLCLLIYFFLRSLQSCINTFYLTSWTYIVIVLVTSSVVLKV